MFWYLALSFRSRGHLGCFSLPFHRRIPNANYANFVYSATLQLQHTKRVSEGGEGRRGKGETRQIYNCNRIECANRNIKIEKNVASYASGKGREEFVFFLLIQNWRSAIFVDSRSCKSTYTRNRRWRGKCITAVKWQQFYLVSLAWLKCPSWIRVTNLDTVTRETTERESGRCLPGPGDLCRGLSTPSLLPHSAPPLGWSYSACGWHFLTMCWLSIYNLRVRRSFSAHTIYLSRFKKKYAAINCHSSRFSGPSSALPPAWSAPVQFLQLANCAIAFESHCYR